MELDREKLIEKFSGKIICIEGCIGIGKSELTKSVYKLFEQHAIPVVLVHEELNTTLLELFNEGPQYGLLFQYEMMTKRLMSIILAKQSSKKGEVVILDTGILRDFAFASGVMKMGYIRESCGRNLLMTLEDLLDSIGRPLPDFIVLLDAANANGCMENIARRGRFNEEKLEKKYLETIIQEYRNSLSIPTIASNTSITTITIDTTQGFTTAETVLLKLLNT